MGYRKLGGFEKLPAVDLARDGKGTETRCTFLDSREWPSTFDPAKTVTSYIVTFDGKKSQFNGTTVLNRILKEAQAGDEIQITYLGEIPNPKKGMNSIKNFEVVVIDPEYEGDDRSAGVSKNDVPF